jgi:protein gp37
VGENSKIAWTHHTFNPWWGCTKVSDGCKNCYAESFAKRTGNSVWGPNADRRFFGAKHWHEPLKWDEAARIAGERRRVFCASMADVFEHRDGEIGEQLYLARLKLWELIARTPGLDWLLLTKRPENIARLGPEVWPSNIWLGTTTEHQEGHDLRWPRLAKAAETLPVVSFLSYEPALGPLELRCMGCGQNVAAHHEGASGAGLSGWFPDWVIIGGESTGGRPFNVEWARDVVQQCKAARIPAFVKQLGSHPIDTFPDRDADWRPHALLMISDDDREHRVHLKDKRAGANWDEWPEDLRVREFPAVRS